MTPERKKRRAYGVAFASAAVIFAALAINLSYLQQFHNGDTVLVAFMSIDRWLPFYWGDNRYGTLLPLLASLVTDYRFNLLLQSQMIALAAVGTVCIVNLFFLHADGTTTTVRLGSASIAIVLLLCLFRENYRVITSYLIGDPYQPSLCLGLAGLAVYFRTPAGKIIRIICGLILITLSLWVNYSNVIPFAILIIGLGIQRPFRRT